MILKNGALTEQIINTMKLQSSVDNPMISISNNGAPVIDINPKYTTVVKTGVRTATGAGITLLTTESGANARDFYVTSASLSLVKDAACDQASGSITFVTVIGGESVFPIRLPILTLTAQNQSIALSFPHPIKVDRGTSIITGNLAFTAGSFILSASVTGFYL